MDARPLSVLDEANQDLGPLLAAANSAARIALDTESDPFHRYFEKVCLIQLSTESEDFIVDPLALGLPPELRAILVDPARTFVLHGADYDVRSLVRSFELALPKVFDTSIAASLLGLTTLGLKALLESQLGIMIEKTEQRSDWGQRPLTQVQLDYARQDTRHLLALAAKLESELTAKGRLAWLEEECAALVARCVATADKTKDFDPEAWKKLKGSRTLGTKGKRALRAMFCFREAEAQRVDRPPFRVARNEVLVKLAELIDKEGLGDVAQLAKTKLVPRGIDRVAFHRAIAEALADQEAQTCPEWNACSGPAEGRDAADARPVVCVADTVRGPSPPSFTPMDAGGKKRLERLRAARAEHAEKLGLDPGFLIAGSILERLARDPPRTLSDLSGVRGLTAWRMEAIGPAILAAVAH